MLKDDKVLKCFWLPPGYYNKCTCGANKHTIKSMKYDYNNQFKAEYFKTHILSQIREIAVSKLCVEEKFIPRSSRFANGFREIVNDALKQIYDNRCGIVFTTDQVIEVLRRIPNADVSFDNDTYFICN